jgi:hypothetical protein
MPIFLVRGAPEALREVKGPVILVTNLVTEGQGMWNFTAGDAIRRMGEAIGRPVDVAIVNTARPSAATLERYVAEHKLPLQLGDVPASCEVVSGDFWGASSDRPISGFRQATRVDEPQQRTQIARHDRRRLAQAVWAVLAQRLL